MRARTVLLALGLALGPHVAAAQSDRVVALVVSVGDGTKRADAIQTELQLMGAETLRSDAPNNAEMRSILIRFAREAAESRATFIYVDAPAIEFEGRDFILPQGAHLERPTDLFTEAIPIQAFSRSAAEADQGGAVMLTVAALPANLPDGLTAVKHAPPPNPSASPVLVGNVGAFGPIVAILEAASRQDEVEAGALLRKMAAIPDVTVSDFPKGLIQLRLPAHQAAATAPAPLPAVAIAAAPPATVAATPQAEPAAPAPNAPTPETLDELTLLEQALSPAAKRTIQRKLRDLGDYKGLVDGIFGPQTRDAIKVFQNARKEKQTGVLTRRQLLDLSS